MALKIAGTTVFDDNKIVLPNNSSEISSNISIIAGAITLDLNATTVFNVTLNANITSVVLQNIQSSGRSSSFILVTTGDGNIRTVNWPATFYWPNGTAPTVTSTNGKKDVYVFFTTDGGTSWQAFISGQNI